MYRLLAFVENTVYSLSVVRGHVAHEAATPQRQLRLGASEVRHSPRPFCEVSSNGITSALVTY